MDTDRRELGLQGPGPGPGPGLATSAHQRPVWGVEDTCQVHLLTDQE